MGFFRKKSAKSVGGVVGASKNMLGRLNADAARRKRQAAIKAASRREFLKTAGKAALVAGGAAALGTAVWKYGERIDRKALDQKEQLKQRVEATKNYQEPRKKPAGK